MNDLLEVRTNLQKRFVIEYPIDSNGTQAAIRAGYSPKTAQEISSALLSKPHIVAAIEKRQAECARAAALTVEWVLNEWRQIASADPNELSWVQLECCRHCYGIDHRYEWTEYEYFQAVNFALAHICNPKSCANPCALKIPPDGLGGFGFTPHRPPLDDCPVCYGKGNPEFCVADTRRLSGPARKLYAGVKKTKDGIEILKRDQDGALKNIATYLGMVIERKQIAGPGGGAIPVAHFTVDDLSDDQLAAIAAGKLMLPMAKTIDAVIEPV